MQTNDGGTNPNASLSDNPEPQQGISPTSVLPPPPGYIKLEGLTDEQLKSVRIIPEDGSSFITPTKNGLYYGDGFYNATTTSDSKYWYKVSNGGGVHVSMDGTSLVTQAIPNRMYQFAAWVAGKEYFIGWKPINEPHNTQNPFYKK